MSSLEADAIPTREDWEMDESDQDGSTDEAYAFRSFFGKSLAEATELFAAGNGMSRFEDLYYMPARVFQFYLRAASSYLLSEASRWDSDSASCFVNLAAFFAEHYPDRLRPAWSGMEPVPQRVVDHQDDFHEASWAIYGNFRLKVHEAVQRGFAVSFPTEVSEFVPRAITAEVAAWWVGRPLCWQTAVQIWRNSGVEGLPQDARKDDILRVFGPPTAVGVVNDPIPDWIRYDTPTHEIRYSFKPDGRVENVFFMKTDKRINQMPPSALLPD